VDKLKISVFEERSKLDRAIVNIEVEDIPLDYKIVEMLTFVTDQLNEKIGEEKADELFFNDFNFDFWFNDEKTKRNFTLDILLFSEDSKELIEKLVEISAEMKNKEN